MSSGEEWANDKQKTPQQKKLEESLENLSKVCREQAPKLSEAFRPIVGALRVAVASFWELAEERKKEKK